MSRRWNVAVVGATGLVGGTMLSILEQRNFPVNEILPLESSRSIGRTVRFRGKDVPVQDLETFDFSRAQIGLFSAGASVSRVQPGTSTPDWNTLSKFSTMSSVVGLVSMRYGVVPPYTSKLILYWEASKSDSVENDVVWRLPVFR